MVFCSVGNKWLWMIKEKDILSFGSHWLSLYCLFIWKSMGPVSSSDCVSRKRLETTRGWMVIFGWTIPLPGISRRFWWLCYWISTMSLKPNQTEDAANIWTRSFACVRVVLVGLGCFTREEQKRGSRGQKGCVWPAEPWKQRRKKDRRVSLQTNEAVLNTIFTRFKPSKHFIIVYMLFKCNIRRGHKVFVH